MSQIRVLIVEDNEDTRAVVAIAVRAFGWEAVAVEGGQQAKDILEQEEFSAAIIDLMMPVVSGLDVVKWIRTRESKNYLPILILSALSDTKDIVVALDAGADDYLVKPFQHAELRARLNALLRVADLMQQLKELNVQLQAAQRELIKKERKLMAMQVVSGVAHNINQSLTALSLQGHLLEKNSSPEQAGALAAIREECASMNRFVQSLINIDADKVEPYVGDITMVKIG